MGLKLFLVLLASLQMILSKETVQKGGVLFEDIGAAQINGEFMTYKRIADTSILQKAAQTATDLTTLYSSFCQGVHNDLKRAAINRLNQEAAAVAEPKWETLITPLKYQLKEAERACSSMNARQPEIHNFEDHKRIQQKALAYKVDYVKAGIRFDQSTHMFKFISNSEWVKNQVFPHLYYGGDYPNWHHQADYTEGKYVIPMAPKYFLAYLTKVDNHRTETMQIKMVSANEMNIETYIICERQIITNKLSNLQDNILYQLTGHNCKRDRESAINIMSVTLTEAADVTNLRINVQKTEPVYTKFFPKVSEFDDISKLLTYKEEEEDTDEYRKRQARSIAEEVLREAEDESSETVEDFRVNNQNISKTVTVDTRHKTNGTTTGNGHSRPRRFAWLPAMATVTAAVAAGNVISSATTGDAPLSWFGNTFSALLGISTEINPKVAKVLTQMATSIDTLKLNDIKIVEALNTVMAKTIAFQKKFSSNAEAMAIMVMERDLFKTIQYVSQVLQMTVQKYVQILASASNRQTSPYALTVKEVDELSRQTLARRGFILNTNLNDIRSTAVIEENQLVLIFQIPILDESKQYHFHRAIAVPVFIGNEVHIPDIDATHIAISKSGSKYIPISVEEYNLCMKNIHECVIHQASRPSHDATSCTIKTFTRSELICPMKKIDPNTPMFYYLDDQDMYFSVKNNTRLYVKCEKHKHSTDYMDQSVDISGQGQVRLRPSCTITTQDGGSFKTRDPEEVQNLTNVPIYEILKHFPQPTGYEITNEDINNTITYVHNHITLAEDEDQALSLADLLAEALKPKKSLTFILSAIMLAGIVISILITMYLCRYKGMACLRIMHCVRSTKHDDYESQTDREEKKMKSRLQKIQYDIYELQNRVTKDKKAPRPRRHSIHDTDSLHESEYVSMRNLNQKDEIEFNQFHTDYNHQFPSILRHQLDQADKAYRRQDI